MPIKFRRQLLYHLNIQFDKELGYCTRSAFNFADEERERRSVGRAAADQLQTESENETDAAGIGGKRSAAIFSARGAIRAFIGLASGGQLRK